MYVSVPVQGEISTACGGQKFNDTMVRNKQFHISISGQMVYWLAGNYVSVLHILSLCKADFRRRSSAASRKSNKADGKIGSEIAMNANEPVH